MAVIGSFVFGFDTDTKDVFDATMAAIKKLEVDVADFCVMTPFPGTPIFKELESQNRILTKDWSKYTMRAVVFEPKGMTAKELLVGVRKMYSQFYSVPYTAKRIIKSLRLGLYPFFLVLARNAVANVNSRAIFKNYLEGKK